MEKIPLTPSLKFALQTQVKKNENATPKKHGFNQIVNILGLGYLTRGQISKINSLFNNPTTLPTDKEKLEVYGEALRSFCDNFTKQEKSKKEISNTIRTSTGHPTGARIAKQPLNRKVDRMNSINTKSSEPPKILKIADLMKEVELEEVQRRNGKV